MMSKSHTVAIAVAALFGFLVARVDLISPAYTADPTANQLAVELGALKTRMSQLESRVSAPTTSPSPSAASDAILAALQNDVAVIKQVLQVSASAVTLTTPGELILQAGSKATLQAGGALKIKTASSAELEAPKIELKSGGLASIRGTTIDVNSSGIASVRGTTVLLNNGSRPVAFGGGRTAGTSTTQLIVDSSASVLVP